MFPSPRAFVYLIFANVYLQFDNGVQASIESGLPGKDCGQHRCLRTEAKCVDPNRGTCQCRGSKHGNGQLSCHPRDEVLCQLLADSNVTNFVTDPPYHLPVPCRYLFSQVETSNPPSLTCRIEVFAHGERIEGQVFPRGFDVSVIKEIAQSSSAYTGYRARGTNREGQYTYTLEVRYGSEDLWTKVTAIDNPDVQFEVDDLNARVTLEVMPCGLRIIYRSKRRQTGTIHTNVLSGLVISVDPRTVDVDWSRTSDSVCLTPSGPRAADIAQTLHLPNNEVAMTYLAFINSRRLDHSLKPSQCMAVKDTLELTCTDPANQSKALTQCHFLLASPRFVTCMEAKGDHPVTVLYLYDICIQAFCKSSVSRCRAVHTSIVVRGCRLEAREDFMKIDCRQLRHPGLGK